MGNQQGKLQHQNQSSRPKKNVHWKSAECPSPPGRPILIPLSDQQPDVVNLRWERPKLDGGSPITGYIVEHRRMGSPHWVRATPMPVPHCEVSISGLEPGWRYQFRAFAENIVGRSDASELSDALTVTLQRNAISVPRFLDELQDMHAVEDERVEFQVRVLGQPPPEINWFKDGYEIFSSRRTKILNDNDASVLIIHQVALTDEGEIKCTATNRAGHVVTKARLLVQAPPKIRLPRTYEDGLIVEADEVLRLKVGVAGQPAPNITWLHEGEVLQNNERFEIINTERNSLLKIDNVQRNDRGEYSVRAANRLGEDVTSFLVTVTARPNPPGQVRLNMSFGKSATLSWTAPIDDGGCKIGNYIVEYFRVGWNVWLKAATTRSLSTTLHDLIEGSEYKFRVKAENPYGLSEPGEESDILFIPDPKRGITKPKSANKLTDNKNDGKPMPPRRKTLSPSRPSQDAATETRVSPSTLRKLKPHIIDNEELHREMSYGTPDQVFLKDVRKSPSQSSADLAAQQSEKNKLGLKIDIPAAVSQQRSPQRSPAAAAAQSSASTVIIPTSFSRSPQRSPTTEKISNLPTAKVTSQPSPTKELTTNFFYPIASKSKKDNAQSSLPLSLPPLATPERSATPEERNIVAVDMARRLSEPTTLAVQNSSPAASKSPSPIKKLSKALQRSAEPVQLDVNQHVRRFSAHSLSPLKNAPALATAIAAGNTFQNEQQGNTTHKTNNLNHNKNNGNEAAQALAKPTIQISAPPLQEISNIATELVTQYSTTYANASTSLADTSPLPLSPSIADKHDEVHTSNEFMLVVFDKHSKVKDKDNHDSFELDLEDAIQAPPISISAPDLASLEFNNLHTFPLRRSVSSTELLYERAMARFYEAVELEEAEKQRKLKASQDKIATPLNAQRKRLGSMTEAERLSFERRSELRRQSADITSKEQRSSFKWSSRDNIATMKPLSRTAGLLMQESQESDEVSDYQTRSAPIKNDSYELASDYTESTASSEEDSIEKFKMELMARTRSPSPRELETYHPRNMSAGIFTPYRAPTPDEAALVLNRPMPLPSPDFVPKPILKRSSNENVLQTETPSTSPTVSVPAVNSEKLDIVKGVKSFFKRDKRSTTEKNTEENQIISNPKEKENAANIAAETEAKKRAKEEEDKKRAEAQKLMHEEAHAAVDHYSDLVRQVSSTRKYHTPLYLDREELKKAAEKADSEGLADEETALNFEHAQLRLSPKMGEDQLIPPISNKPRLSISERGQLRHVRETGSNLAMTQKQPMVKQPSQSDTPSEDSAPILPASSASLTLQTDEEGYTSTIVSETTEERPDARGRTRIVKVKRIIKKRVPSSTRSRDSSLSRPASSVSNVDNNSTLPYIGFTEEYVAPARQRSISRNARMPLGASQSPATLRRRLPTPIAAAARTTTDTASTQNMQATALSESIALSLEPITDEEAHEKVRSALSYSTDLVLFLVACYLYLFKDARLVLPILALMAYRQLGEAISAYIPNWLKRKKN